MSVVADYSFESDSDGSRAIAAILTPALRFGGWIVGSVPIEIVEAKESQTGKGYFVRRRAAVYDEHPIIVTANCLASCEQ